MTTRVIEPNEYRRIIELLPNRQSALALQLQASLGLRIGDVLALRVSNFKNGRLEKHEKKTGKLQYREINKDVYAFIKDYAIEQGLSQKDALFNIGVRAVQKQLKSVTTLLNLTNISTHSFRKLFATTIYENNNHDLELVKELLNHSSITTTQRYIRVSQQAIDKASAGVNFMDW